MMRADQAHSNQLSYLKKIWTATGIISLAVVILILFKVLFSLLLLVLAAVLLAVYFHGCASLLQRLHLSTKISILCSVMLNVLLLVGFLWFMGFRLQQQVGELTETLPNSIQRAKEQISQSAMGAKFLHYLQSSGTSQKTISIASAFFSSSFGIVSDLYIIILTGLFFTASPSLYKKGLIQLLPAGAKEQGRDLISVISDILRKWIKGQIFGFFFIAILTALALLVLGMPLIFTLSLIAGLLNLIPNFGPIIAFIPAALLGLSKGTTTVMLLAGVYILIQVVQSAITQPLIQKKMINIPPALIILGQVAMGALGGFWGVLLATPIVAIIMKIINKLYVDKQC